MSSQLALTVSETTASESIQPGIVSRALLVRFVSVVGSSIGFYLPLAVVPLFAKQAGSASDAALPTAALLMTSVAGELLSPRLIAYLGYRCALATGLTLLGPPAVVLILGRSEWVIIAISMIRGCGFAICVVAGGALSATLIPAARRGEGLALVGLVGGVPSMLALPAGIWLTDHYGFDPVFVITAAATTLAALSVPALPRTALPTSRGDYHGVVAGLRNRAIMRPATIFVSSTAAVGVLLTFLPIATADQPAWVATAALLAQPAGSTAARCVAGRIGDRHGQQLLLTPGVLLSAVGMAMVADTTSPVAVIGGAVAFGLGFGVLQNATLVLMYSRAPIGSEGAVSAIWNATYDLGMAAGALGAGLIVTTAGYPTTLLLAGALMLPALAIVRRDRDSRHLRSRHNERRRLNACCTPEHDHVPRRFRRRSPRRARLDDDRP